MYQATIDRYKCKDCNQITDYPDLQRDLYDHSFCPECEGEVEYFDDRPSLWVSVALYFVSRSYGGPEEGGWWYDDGSRDDSTIRCFEACDYPQVQLYKDLLRMRYPEQNLQFRCYAEKLAPKSFPESKPFYH